MGRQILGAIAAGLTTTDREGSTMANPEIYSTFELDGTLLAARHSHADLSRNARTTFLREGRRRSGPDPVPSILGKRRGEGG